MILQPAIHADWKKLLLANYVIDPDILKPFIPFQTELALWQGKCYISLVGFRFLKVRIGGVPVPFHTNFNEVNLRFYVRRLSGHIWHYGVVFIKEIVALPVVTFVANTFFSEHYETLPLHHNIHHAKEALSVSYRWKKDIWHSMHIESGPNPSLIEDNTAEEFLTSQHWGYSKVNEEKTIEYSVEHPRWSVYPTINYQIRTDFEKAYGQKFGFLNQTQPESVFLTEGSAIILKKRITVKF